METLNQVRRKVAELSRLIDSPKRLSPTFGQSEQSGRPHIEVTGTDYHFVVGERGSENSRKSTTDLNELLFWIYDSITFSMACDLELRNRRENEDFRIQLFQIQEDLIALIDREYLLARICNSRLLTRDFQSHIQKTHTPMIIYPLWRKDPSC